MVAANNDPAPLSPQERARVYTLIANADPVLADRVAAHLDERDDPLFRLFSDGLNGVQGQMRTYMLVTVGLSVVAMCLNAGLVGISVSVQSAWGTLGVNQHQTSGNGNGNGNGSSSAPSPPVPLGPTMPTPEP